MKTLLTLFILTSSCFLSFSQSVKEGYFKTYEDYLNRKVVKTIDIDWIGRGLTIGPHYVHYGGKKEKIDEEVNWGCTDEGIIYRFYGGVPYQIFKEGKIMTYKFYEVNATGGQKRIICYSIGNHATLTRIKIIKKSLGAKLFSDDKEISKRFEEGLVSGLAGQNINYLNLLTCIDLYNIKHKIN